MVVASVGFFGVLLSQLWTSVRDQRRVDQEKHDRDVNRRAEVYAEFHRTVTALNTDGVEQTESAATLLAELAQRRSLIMLLASPMIRAETTRVVDGLTAVRAAYARAPGSAEHEWARREFDRSFGWLVEIMRHELDLGLKPRWWQRTRRRIWSYLHRRLSGLDETVLGGEGAIDWWNLRARLRRMRQRHRVRRDEALARKLGYRFQRSVGPEA